MKNDILDKKCLESLLQAHWTEFLDHKRFMRIVLETVRDTDYRILEQEYVPPKQVKLSVTKFTTTENEFEIWAEFTVPKENGVVIGTNVYQLTLSGELKLKDSYGTHFRPSKLYDEKT